MKYFIPDKYTARLDAEQDFEGENKVDDTYQDEVYCIARKLADDHNYHTILDVGTGSGFKLMKYFKNFATVGLDLPPAIPLLREKYPDRKWVTQSEAPAEADIIICSDVIEHVVDPDALCEFIKSLNPKHAVISTPDRDLVCEVHNQPPLGPPRNVTHVREWDFTEFEGYMRSHFNVEHFFYSNLRQFTMCAVVTLSKKDKTLVQCKDCNPE